MSRWKWALIAVAIVLAGVIAWRLVSQREGAAARGAGAAEAPVPVTVVAVEQKDVPVYLNALGTVQALNTVTINAQVSGQLKSINFKEGQEVKSGELIAEIDPRTFQAAFDQAAAKKKQDEAQLSASRSTLARYEDLIKQHFVAAQDLENQRQLVRQQEALVAADDAAMSSAKTQLGYTRITAPIDGMAGIRQVDVGNLIAANAGTGIVTLTEVHPINVIFSLPEQNLDLVRTTDDASDPLPVTALDRNDSHPIADGVLKVIDNQIDTTTGTFKLKAEFANTTNTLWPGQFVNVRVEVRTVTGGLVVPATAVQRGPDGSYAYVLQADNTVAMTPLQLGSEASDNTILVTSGLKAGDKVVTEGQFRLKPGSKVEALAPGQAAPATSAADLDKLKGQNPQQQQQQRGGGRRRGGGG
ncbi:MAG TPA: efflux RND transporter periplasmic adaptor subunit [Rhodanobacteraceae bacterium]|jgi:multidrug efflux system membrane fusion protein|nr:efflux RND transporter periplasmic adaptor subunit [Rhodanobacteraceae bacterium]